MTASITDLADYRARRALPPAKREHCAPQAPQGLAPGDRVRCRRTGAVGTVLSFRIERLVDETGAAPPQFLIAVRFPDAASFRRARDLEPLSNLS